MYVFCILYLCYKYKYLIYKHIIYIIYIYNWNLSMLQLETPSQVTRLLRQVLSCSKGFQKAFVAVDGSEIWQTHQLGVGSCNLIFYRVSKTSKRWLGMGFLNHQQYHRLVVSNELRNQNDANCHAYNCNRNRHGQTFPHIPPSPSRVGRKWVWQRSARDISDIF